MNWIFLRGLGREKRHWEDFPKNFETKLPGEKVFFLELPGVGEKNHQKCPFFIKRVVHLLREEFLQLQNRHPGEWNIMSISLGSMVALKWCELYPEDFKRAVVMNTSAQNCATPWQRMQWPALWISLQILFCKDPEKKEKLILEMISNASHEQKNQTQKKWAQYGRERPMFVSNLLRQLLVAALFRVSSKFVQPLLILNSKEDHMVSAQCSENLVHFLKKNSKNEVYFYQVEKAGHDLPLENPFWVIERVREFLQLTRRNF